MKWLIRKLECLDAAVENNIESGHDKDNLAYVKWVIDHTALVYMYMIP